MAAGGGAVGAGGGAAMRGRVAGGGRHDLRRALVQERGEGAHLQVSQGKIGWGFIW